MDEPCDVQTHKDDSNPGVGYPVVKKLGDCKPQVERETIHHDEQVHEVPTTDNVGAAPAPYQRVVENRMDVLKDKEAE